MEHFRADEAKQYASRNLKGPVIAPFLEYVYKQIKAEASVGKFTLTLPFAGMTKYPTTEEREATFDALRSQGYKVTHHPNPDPGHPCSSDYDEISWA